MLVETTINRKKMVLTTRDASSPQNIYKVSTKQIDKKKTANYEKAVSEMVSEIMVKLLIL